MTNETIGHFECNSVEGKNQIKYLVLDDLDENKEVLKKYEEVWKGIEKEIETINSDEKIEYGKVFLKIRLESNDNLPLNKPIKLRLLTIIIRSVFSENGKFYPRLFLDEALNDQYKNARVSKG